MRGPLVAGLVPPAVMIPGALLPVNRLTEHERGRDRAGDVNETPVERYRAVEQMEQMGDGAGDGIGVAAGNGERIRVSFVT